MRPRLHIRLLLSVLLMILASGSPAIADDDQRMAEMQQALNAEVLAQPFRVAEPSERRLAAAQTQQQNPVPCRSKSCGRFLVYPRVHIGWHDGYPFRRYRLHHDSHVHGYHRR
jgi:hypothetical protein